MNDLLNQIQAYEAVGRQVLGIQRSAFYERMALQRMDLPFRPPTALTYFR